MATPPSKNSRSVNDLLAAIQRKAPSPEPEAITPPPPPEPQRKRSRIGKPVQFWMHEEDLRIVRELSAWLAGQGVRASDSLVIRTALRSAQVGSDFLQAYRDAAQLDGRLKQNTQSPQTPYTP